MTYKFIRTSFLCRVLVGIAFFSILLTPLPVLAEVAAAEPVKAFNASLIEAMKRADELGYSGRYKLLEPVIEKVFALQFMCRQAAGRYWRTFTAQEKDELLNLYTEWSVAAYAGRFDGYSGERFEVLPNPPAGDTVSVISKLIKTDGKEVEFDYLLRKIENAWRIVDIRISGVSQLALTRAQFTGLLKEKGFRGLIASLKEKVQAYSRSSKK